MANEKIVFEDLRGVSDGGGDLGRIEIDLDAETPGMRRLAPKVDKAPADDEDPEFVVVPRKADAGQGDGGEDDDDAGDDDKFSRKFQARLEREQRAKRRERQLREATETENVQLKRQLAKSTAAATKDTKESLDRQINAIEQNLEQAIEKADTKLQVRLTSDLTDAKARRIAADYGPAPIPGQDDEPGTSTTPVRAQLAQEWKDGHSDWYARSGFERHTRIANRIDKEVHAAGFDPSEEDYFEELDKRLKKAIPDVFDTVGKTGDDDADSERLLPRSRDKGRSPVAPAGDGSRTQRQVVQTGKVELNEDDFVSMRKFGLDPNDPAVLKEFAKNRRQLLAGGN